MSLTKSELFNFIQGSTITGESVYDIWKSLNPQGTEQEFIDSIKGKSACEYWLELECNSGKTEEDFINWLGTDNSELIANEIINREAADAQTLSDAKSYTDNKISTEANARTAGDAQTLTDAKTYTDEKIYAESIERETGDTNSLEQAKAYTDNLVDEEKSARQTGDADSLAQAKAYTDDMISSVTGGSAVNIAEISTAVNTLVGTDTAKSVRQIANEELAAQLIPENAKESLDTVQELAAWIQSHPDDAAAMNADIVRIDGALTAHTSNTSNPHNVTVAQIGLENVDNTSDADKPVSNAQAIAIADAKKAGTDAQSNLTSHINNTSNPHNVIASQINYANTTSGLTATSVQDAIDEVSSNIPTTDTGTVISQNADYAEVGQWVDGNVDNEDRIGYFVSIDNDTAGTTMVKATSNSDVRGVTVEAPAFSGNCSADKFDSNGKLLKQYSYVAVMGLVSVIDNGRCTINERCMPDDNGTAIPSTNNMGYQVIDRIDDTHILVAVEPGADMLNRIKAQTTQIQQSITAINNVESSTVNGNIKINGTETTVYTHPAGTNPHGTTKADLGLSDVENKSSATIRGELTKENVVDALGYTPLKSGGDVNIGDDGTATVSKLSHSIKIGNFTFDGSADVEIPIYNGQVENN